MDIAAAGRSLQAGAHIGKIDIATRSMRLQFPGDLSPVNLAARGRRPDIPLDTTQPDIPAAGLHLDLPFTTRGLHITTAGLQVDIVMAVADAHIPATRPAINGPDEMIRVDIAATGAEILIPRKVLQNKIPPTRANMRGHLHRSINAKRNGQPMTPGKIPFALSYGHQFIPLQFHRQIILVIQSLLYLLLAYIPPAIIRLDIYLHTRITRG